MRQNPRRIDEHEKHHTWGSNIYGDGDLQSDRKEENHTVTSERVKKSESQLLLYCQF